MDIHERFEQYNDDYGKFSRIENKRSDRSDLHAFLLLAEQFPQAPTKGTLIINGASGDQVWLDISKDQIETLTDDQILELVRCGVMHSPSYETLSLFV